MTHLLCHLQHNVIASLKCLLVHLEPAGATVTPLLPCSKLLSMQDVCKSFAVVPAVLLGGARSPLQEFDCQLGHVRSDAMF